MKLGIYKVLMEEMAAMTLPECKSSCRVPLSCCDLMYCQITQQYARDVYGIELPTAVGSDAGALLFMTETGCSVAPYLRPLCTLHTCDINSLGFKNLRHDGALEWTEQYFALRERLEELIGVLTETQERDNHDIA